MSLGAGGTWPGEVALAFNPHVFQYFAKKFVKGIILIAGTNGKTTTSLMIKKILESDNNLVVHNDSGANLLNGIVSACIKHSSWTGSFEADYGVFEVDENTLPQALSAVSRQLSAQTTIVLLNLFRDQLDRYGEVDVIAEKWERVLESYGKQDEQNEQNEQESKTSKTRKISKNVKVQLIANADDPLIAHIAKVATSRPGPASPAGRLEVRAVYFGINEKAKFIPNLEHATDSIFCLTCGSRLLYDGIYYSHLGIWKCPKCGEKRPLPDLSTWKSPLPGLYNTYNTLAAVSVVKSLGYKDTAINKTLAQFSPAFGRQEEFELDGKKVKIFLSKNPAGFNEVLKTVLELGATQLLLVLNDRIPDGRDVSWIWDVDFEMIANVTNKQTRIKRIMVSGDRVYDIALRLKYADPTKFQISNFKFQIEEDLKKAIVISIDQASKSETLYILATYSAMLEVRKILKGRKIL